MIAMNGGPGGPGGGGFVMNGHGPPLQQRYGVFVPSRILIPISLAIIFMITSQGKALWQVIQNQSQNNNFVASSNVAAPYYLKQQQTSTNSATSSHIQSGTNTMFTDPTTSTFYYENKINSLRQSHTKDSMNNNSTCRWYLAESALGAGLGVFTSIGLHKNDIVGYPDLCIFVSDAPTQFTHLSTHTFGTGSFFGQYESNNNRAACEGFTTNYNTVPDKLVNTELVSPVLQTNAGLHRATSPGAGAISHNFGIHGRAIDTIPAGSELTINYGDWDFDQENNARKYMKRPSRTVEDLQENGWCIDNVIIGLSNIPNAGRGVFAKRYIKQNEIIIPAPIQVYPDRKIFYNNKQHHEQLFINYCIEIPNTNILLYPYGAASNLINHNHNEPNVQWQWSTSKLHKSEWLQMNNINDFWKIVTPGGLILEIIAIRDIYPGEELVIDYGIAWDKAWEEHIKTWKPVINATQYMYPSELDETTPLRTIKEQKNNPYPKNIITMCVTSNFQRQNHYHMIWNEPNITHYWESMVYCHILEKEINIETGDWVYDVELLFNIMNNDNEDDNNIAAGRIISPTLKYQYNPSIPYEERYIDMKVPRHAIRFIEIPYLDDEHLPNAFRHPLSLPESLIPDLWREK